VATTTEQTNQQNPHTVKISTVTDKAYKLPPTKSFKMSEINHLNSA